MAGLACVACRKFMRVIKNGVNVEEGMPLTDDPDGPWGPYKLWRADLYICPGCGFKLVAGFGREPFVEHYESAYTKMRELNPPIITVNDCGGAKP